MRRFRSKNCSGIVATTPIARWCSDCYKLLCQCECQEFRGGSQNQRGIWGRPVVLLQNAARLSEHMATRSPEEERLLQAYSIIDNTPDMEETIAKLRDLLSVDHLVYHSSKLGVSPVGRPLHSPDLSGFLDQALPANGICRCRPGPARGISARASIRLERAESLESAAEGAFLVDALRAWRRAARALHPAPEQARASGPVLDLVFAIGPGVDELL